MHVLRKLNAVKCFWMKDWGRPRNECRPTLPKIQIQSPHADPCSLRNRAVLYVKSLNIFHCTSTIKSGCSGDHYLIIIF